MGTEITAHVAIATIGGDTDVVLAARQSQHTSTEVEKEVELQFDLGNRPQCS